MTKQVSKSVSEHIAQIDKAIAQIESPLKEEKTSGEISLPGGVYNIHKETNVQTLLEIAAFLMAKEHAYNKAAEALKLDTYPKLKISGSTPEAWMNDIHNRIAIIKAQSKLDKLKEAKKQLEKFLTEQEQKDKIFASIKNLL